MEINMLRRTSWLVMFSLLCVPSPAAAQIKLTWQFKRGDRFFVEEVTDVRQTIKIADSESRQDIRQTKVSRCTVLDRAKDGGTVLQQVIESVKIKYLGEGPDADTSILKRLEGSVFKVTLDRAGKVIKLTGHDALLRQIAKENPANAKLVRALVTEECFKNGIEEWSAILPEKAVAKGQSWQRTTALPLGPLGGFTLDNRYTLEEIDEAANIARIALTATGQYAPPRHAVDPALNIRGGELRLTRSSGTLRFDIAHGRLLYSEGKQSLQGTLRLDARDARLPMELHQEQVRTIRFLERWPIQK
jgi:Family of unknown function (DUF6263)